MHSDLSAHLHSDECNAIIKRLQNCRQENAFMKFLGACNDIDRELVKCLRRDREAKRKKNKESSDLRYKRNTTSQ
ncbi:COX assembly mitochondrial protein 2 homolog [Ctenocephalides felis]|uniref:COX assembly mitochondrial protein 2 homolog n=1 Tax=Ctenocephalides felis TaxID=7515 RepID=UPI000E6E1999|nr:COX assembly mitochondrial protein 2 homolog [Ctenocephalides felis]